MEPVKHLNKKRLGIFVRAISTIFCAMFVVLPAMGQQQSADQIRYAEDHRLKTMPRLAIKSNMLYNLTTTPSIGIELRLGKKVTFDAPFHINPWFIDKEKNSKFKFLLVQPQFRLWTCESFNGHFFGIHGHYAFYNVGALPTSPIPFTDKMNKYRFQGHLYGAGISYGFQWILGKRWGFEFEIGGGYARLEYDEFDCLPCATEFQIKRKDYWGVTKAGISLMYFIF